jgi:hypothetical protein
MWTQLFIHYGNITPLHYITVFPSPTSDCTSYDMVHVVFPYVHIIFYTLLHKISNSRTFPMLIYFLDISTLPKTSSLENSILPHEA